MKSKYLVNAFLLCLFSTGQTAFACDCTGPRGKAALANATASFSGKVIKIVYLDDPEQANPEPRIVVTFKVYRVWKGEPKKTIVLHTVFNKWTCAGYAFKEGTEYLVFAHANDAAAARRFPKAKTSMGVNPCDGTFPLDQARDDVQELGPGRSISKPTE